MPGDVGLAANLTVRFPLGNEERECDPFGGTNEGSGEEDVDDSAQMRGG